MPKKLPRRYFLEPLGKMNDTIWQSLPDVTPQKKLHVKDNSENKIIPFVWELTAKEIFMLRAFYEAQNLEFLIQVWVQCGENDIRPADESEWNPELKKKAKRKKIITRNVNTFVSGG